MDRNSKQHVSDKAIQTACIGGVYIIDKRIGYGRRLTKYKYQKKYDRRLGNWTKSINRRNLSIYIVI
jgi:hypothetical protein